MKVAYFDCFSGVAGDMILGALVDAGLDVGALKKELEKLKLTGYQLSAGKTMKNGISGTKVSIEIAGEHAERRLKDVLEIIAKSKLDGDVKEMSSEIFKALAEAEAKVHNSSVDEVQFHELGSLDTIIDVVGSVLALKRLGVEAVYSSKVHLGSGFVTCRHGTIPVPSPATLELLKGVPVFSPGIEAELTTPTGAAILKTISRSFGVMPDMKIERLGYGAGDLELEIPNMLRVYIGELDEMGDDGGYEKDSVVLVETNIDDMNPEFFDYLSEKLLEQGALDVFMTPVFMKKSRPGTLLSVQTLEEKLEEVLATIFTETTTLGVRIRKMERRKLVKKTISAKTRFGPIRVKLGMLKGNVTTVAPEYEDCKAAAREFGASLGDVYDGAKEAAWRMMRE